MRWQHRSPGRNKRETCSNLYGRWNRFSGGAASGWYRSRGSPIPSHPLGDEAAGLPATNRTLGSETVQEGWADWRFRATAVAELQTGSTPPGCVHRSTELHGPESADPVRRAAFGALVFLEPADRTGRGGDRASRVAGPDGLRGTATPAPPARTSYPQRATGDATTIPPGQRSRSTARPPLLEWAMFAHPQQGAHESQHFPRIHP